MKQKPNPKLRDLLNSKKAKILKLSELSKIGQNRLARLNRMLDELKGQRKVINKVKVKGYGYCRYLRKLPDVGCLSVADSSRLFVPCLSLRMDTSDISIDFALAIPTI